VESNQGKGSPGSSELEFRVQLPRGLAEALRDAGYVAELVARRSDGKPPRDYDRRAVAAHVAGYEEDIEGDD
jgi:hypothetical protein